MGRGGEGGTRRRSNVDRSMVMQQLTPRRTAIQKLQDQRAKDLESGDTDAASKIDEVIAAGTMHSYVAIEGLR
jgi:hypothetical protein